jgi:hypothetical protein
MTRTVHITITASQLDTAIIALALRRFILRNTAALVWDNCAVGSEDQPRKIEASFPAAARETNGKPEQSTMALD